MTQTFAEYIELLLGAGSVGNPVMETSSTVFHTVVNDLRGLWLSCNDLMTSLSYSQISRHIYQDTLFIFTHH